MTPTVSIIIAVYNRPQLLLRALESVLSQTFTNWECVIIDDGSTDDTYQVAEHFINGDSRFVLIKTPHSGESDVVNQGFKAARGKYIALLDSDDEYLPTHLELRVTELESNPDIDFLHGGIQIIGDDMVPDKYDVSKKINLYDPSVLIGGTIFGKRDVFLSLNGFNKLSYAADSDFIERVMKNFKVKRVDWPTYLYHRDHQDSITKELEREESKKYNKGAVMQLGNFSLSLTVKDIAASKTFYEKLGFSVIHGDQEQGWLIMQNQDLNIGLFQGMIEKNMLTFNPGWDTNGKELETFTDIRDLQKVLKDQGVTIQQEAAEGNGPSSFMISDPDGNPILFDQHVTKK